ncbi:protein kinase domain-containing protein [Pendulispora albinea]|uniref:non-specific serine/threonine protein kinase n=1 Tax=Pendulispora albinea TaxID=2741071 RepID=A0ABZ2LUX7_9BACT
MVGRYHLIEEVGRSTFGPLHLARYEGPNAFQRWSSILEVEARFSRDSEFRHAFFQSARTSARIQHPNVVATLDVGETEGMLWLASEYLLGETAKELLTLARHRQVPVPWDIACRIVADAALGLDAIHELTHATTGEPMRLVHGRLAPHRIAVTYDGVTKVLEPSAPFVALSPGEAGQAKMMVGRAMAYTAPELLRGEAFDRRVDIFSLGVVLWELCAGRRLFGGADEGEIRAKIHANAVPPLSEAVRGFPAEVEALIHQTLAPDPASRMQNAKALARALHQALVKEGLVVTDDEVARYLLHSFPERLPRKKSRLLTAADVTHVFRRDAVLPVAPSASGASAAVAPTPAVPFAPPFVSGAVRLPSDTIPDDLPPPLLFRPSESPNLPGASPVSPVPEAARVSAVPVSPVPGAARVSAAPVSPVPGAARVSAVPGAPRTSQVPGSGRGTQAPVLMPIGMPPRPRGLFDTDSGSRSPWIGPAILFVVFGVAVAVIAVLVVVMVRRSNAIDAPVAALSAAAAPMPPPVAAPSAVTPVPTPSTVTPVPTPSTVIAAPTSAATPSTATPLPTLPAVTPRPQLPAATSVALAAPSPAPIPLPRPSASAAAPPAPKGRLTVICDPACDDVLDGKSSLGPSPIYKRATSLGTHRLTLKTTDPKAEKVVEVDVVEGDVTVVKESLLP